jgi:hypothetical protein
MSEWNPKYEDQQVDVTESLEIPANNFVYGIYFGDNPHIKVSNKRDEFDRKFPFRGHWLFTWKIIFVATRWCIML